MNEIPLISVAMPVYNGEKFLSEAVLSVLNQSFKNFEFIIIDDGSTDRSLELLRYYEKRDSRIKLISRENKNVAATLNEIILMSRGKWIARMDQDDICLPNRFEKQLEWLNYTKADICGSWVKRFGAEDRVVKMRESHKEIELEMLFCSPFAHPSVLINKKVFDKISYNEGKWQAEDYDFWVSAFEFNFKMTNIPEILLYYRVHSAQISVKEKSSQKDLGVQIQKRYWKLFLVRKKINNAGIFNALEEINGTNKLINIASVNLFFTSLFNVSNKIYWPVIKENLNKTYFRIASKSILFFIQWIKINKKFNCGSSFIGLQIFLISIFKINYNSFMFGKLRKLHTLVENI
jgi:glycosyltransferase involved in cell wall biosynthesis